MRQPDRSEPARTPPRSGPRACLVPGCTDLARMRPRHASPLDEHGCIDPSGAVPLCCAHHTMRDRFELFVSFDPSGVAFWDAAGARIVRRRVPLLPPPTIEARAGESGRGERRARG